MTRKKSREILLLEKHYDDMYGLNKLFIDALRRPTPTPSIPLNLTPKRRRLTKKQLKALEQGRKKLASKRGQQPQI